MAYLSTYFEPILDKLAKTEIIYPKNMEAQVAIHFTKNEEVISTHGN
jgi:hypothetical protein